MANFVFYFSLNKFIPPYDDEFNAKLMKYELHEKINPWIKGTYKREQNMPIERVELEANNNTAIVVTELYEALQKWSDEMKERFKRTEDIVDWFNDLDMIIDKFQCEHSTGTRCKYQDDCDYDHWNCKIDKETNPDSNMRKKYCDRIMTLGVLQALESSVKKIDTLYTLLYTRF